VTLFFDSVETEKALGSPPGRLVAGEPLGFAMRIAAPMVQEAAWLLSEGCRPEEVDEAMLDWGFRRGPFTLVDEVGIDAFVRADALLEAAHGARLRPPPILKRLLARGVRRVRGEHPRSGASFYDAAGLAAPRSGRRLPVRREIIQMRCALRLVNEAILCLDDGGVSAARDGDVIAVKSVGFPPFRGGPFRYVEELGAAELSARMRGFEASFGSRFTPAPRLSDLAGRGGCFER
jgi:3-hydroxyacyl-CoA dehydrogenase/enoyl-CoA hydratase/3-hydroxybutyryl-CoA epimerase